MEAFTKECNFPACVGRAAEVCTAKWASSLAFRQKHLQRCCGGAGWGEEEVKPSVCVSCTVGGAVRDNIRWPATIVWLKMTQSGRERLDMWLRILGHVLKQIHAWAACVRCTFVWCPRVSITKEVIQGTCISMDKWIHGGGGELQVDAEKGQKSSVLVPCWK